MRCVVGCDRGVYSGFVRGDWGNCVELVVWLVDELGWVDVLLLYYYIFGLL